MYCHISSDGTVVLATHVIHVTNQMDFPCYSVGDKDNLTKRLDAEQRVYTVETLTYSDDVQNKVATKIYKSEEEAINDLTGNISLEDKITLLSESQNIKIEDAKMELEVKEKITKGEITKDNFDTLSDADKELVKLILFKGYSPSESEKTKALSAVEFTLVSIIKILDKTLDRTKLTLDELALFDALVATFKLNDMPIDNQTDWRFQYLQKEFTNTQTNRQSYFQKKNDVIGHV